MSERYQEKMEPQNCLPLTIDDSGYHSLINGITCYEVVNVKILDQLIKSKLLKTTVSNKMKSVFFESEKDQLMAYKANIKGNYKKGFVLVKVKYNMGKIGIGRVSPDKSLGFINLRRQIRDTLCKGVYIDIDIENAQPTILHQLCEANGIVSVELKRYVERRNEYLKAIMDTYGVNRKSAKNLFIQIIYGGSFMGWYKENGLDACFKDGIVILDFIDRYATEIKQIQRIISSQNMILHELRDKSKKKLKNTDNLDGSILSYVLQDYERRVLEVIFEYCLKNGYIKNSIVSLCYDGIMILEELFKPEILSELKREVNEKLSLNLTFTAKEFEDSLIEQLMTESKFEKEEEVEFDPKYMVNLDKDYMKSLDTYEEKKAYFENFVCKIDNPDPCYVKIYRDTDRNIVSLNIMKSSQLIENFCEMKSNVYKKDMNLAFIDMWRVDEDLKRYEKLDFLPFNGSFDENQRKKSKIFNLFTGYNKEVLEYDYKHKEDGTEKSVEEITIEDEKLLKPFMKLVLELCGGKWKNANYFLRYMCHLIQRPQEKMPIAIVIKGRQGTGKNTMLDTYSRIIGDEHYITSSNPEDFFGDHAEGFYHKLLVNMNEMESKDAFNFESNLKTFITEDTITINPKFQRPTKVNNYCRLVIFSNRSNPVSIDIMGGDRRYVVFESTDFFVKMDEKGNKKFSYKFWKDMRSHFKRIDFLNALYRYHCNYDLDEWNFMDRPITEAYRAMISRSIPVEVMFLTEFIEKCDFERKCRYDIVKGGTIIEDKYQEGSLIEKEDCPYYDITSNYIGEELFKEFKKYCIRNNFTKIDGSTNIASFYDKITNLHIPFLFGNSKGYKTMKIKPSEVYTYFKNKKWVFESDEDYIRFEEEMRSKNIEEDEKEFEGTLFSDEWIEV